MLKVLLLLSTFCYAHTFHAQAVSEFNYSIKDKTIFLEFSISEDNLKNLDSTYHCPYNKTKILCLTNQIKKETQVKVGSEAIKFEFIKAQVFQGILKMNFKSSLSKLRKQKIYFKNNFMHSFNSKFENRVSIHVLNTEKSFLLDKKINSFQITIS